MTGARETKSRDCRIARRHNREGKLLFGVVLQVLPGQHSSSNFRVVSDYTTFQKYRPHHVPAYPKRHLPVPVMTYTRRQRESSSMYPRVNAKKQARRLARKNTTRNMRKLLIETRDYTEGIELHNHESNPVLPRIVVTAPENDTKALDDCGAEVAPAPYSRDCLTLSFMNLKKYCFPSL